MGGNSAAQLHTGRACQWPSLLSRRPPRWADRGEAGWGGDAQPELHAGRVLSAAGPGLRKQGCQCACTPIHLHRVALQGVLSRHNVAACVCCAGRCQVALQLRAPGRVGWGGRRRAVDEPGSALAVENRVCRPEGTALPQTRCTRVAPQHSTPAMPAAAAGASRTRPNSYLAQWNSTARHAPLLQQAQAALELAPVWRRRSVHAEAQAAPAGLPQVWLPPCLEIQAARGRGGGSKAGRGRRAESAMHGNTSAASAVILSIDSVGCYGAWSTHVSAGSPAPGPTSGPHRNVCAPRSHSSPRQRHSE